jgi:hypothetical protein
VRSTVAPCLFAGDDPAAKAAVTQFLDAIGYDTVDAGALGPGGRRFQFGTNAFVTPYGGLSDERGYAGRCSNDTRRSRPVTATRIPGTAPARRRSKSSTSTTIGIAEQR